jgi:hypothetical protein
MPALEDQGEAQGGLQRVLIIVVTDIDGLVVKVMAGEYRINVPEQAIYDLERRRRVKSAENSAYSIGNRTWALGVGYWEHERMPLVAQRFSGEGQPRYGIGCSSLINDLRKKAARPISLGLRFYDHDFRTHWRDGMWKVNRCPNV